MIVVSQGLMTQECLLMSTDYFLYCLCQVENFFPTVVSGRGSPDSLSEAQFTEPHFHQATSREAFPPNS